MGLSEVDFGDLLVLNDSFQAAARKYLAEAQRVTVLHLGKIFARGSLEAIIQDEKVAEIYLGKTHEH